MSLLLELPLLQTFGVMLEENIEVHESLIDVGKVGLSASFWRRVVGGIYVKNKQTEFHDAILYKFGMHEVLSHVKFLMAQRTEGLAHQNHC
jgi:hypothetical protein